MKVPHLTPDQKERVLEVISEMTLDILNLQGAIKAAEAHAERQNKLVDEYNTLRGGEVTRKLAQQLAAIKEERAMLQEQDPRFAKAIQTQAQEVKSSLRTGCDLTKEITSQLYGLVETRMRDALAPFYSDAREFPSIIGNSDAMGALRYFCNVRGQVPLGLTDPDAILAYASGCLQILRKIRDDEDVLTFTGCTLDGETAPATL